MHLLNLLLLFEFLVHLTWSEPLRYRRLSFDRNKNVTRRFKFDITIETSMNEKEFFKIFNSCVKECLKLQRAIQRDKCLASVCDIY